jgi:hypothetical protein
MPRFDWPFDPTEATGSRWGKRNLPPIECVIALADEAVIPEQGRETVTVKLEASDDSNRPVFGEPSAVINLMVG